MILQFILKIDFFKKRKEEQIVLATETKLENVYPISRFPVWIQRNMGGKDSGFKMKPSGSVVLEKVDKDKVKITCYAQGWEKMSPEQLPRD